LIALPQVSRLLDWIVFDVGELITFLSAQECGLKSMLAWRTEEVGWILSKAVYWAEQNKKGRLIYNAKD
jgi:hypothetical protein